MEENNTNHVANQPLNTADTAKTAHSVPAPETSAPQTTTQSSTDALKQKLSVLSFPLSQSQPPLLKKSYPVFLASKKPGSFPLSLLGSLLYFLSSIPLLPKSTLQLTNLSLVNK